MTNDETIYKPCPFCGHYPRIDHEFLPTIVECRCVNPKCFVQPILQVEVECIANIDGNTFTPLFDKAYPILQDRWNSRNEVLTAK